ncbi:YqaJ viral recombinase family protein [Streptomyces cinnabarinus]|uniref:YqaJ viral recombinase family protein n=1 Tax=Streptomyces cinnabarinus TaxID=67287 RepID=A0ABY7K9C3_9ACTN|nr:YqaJ viral recombinase family protein [Streptomyces cinnabarinus]WAZ20240.1 YqaJ viral recombinase family protein [Streptomyces cinnabarinus]
MTTTRPASTPTTAATKRAAVEAKAEEEQTEAAPVTPPAPDAIPTTHPESTSPAGARSAVEGSKAGEERTPVTAPETLPAPGGPQTARTTSTSPADDLSTGSAGAKAGEEPPGRTPPPVTRPAPYGPQPTGPEAGDRVSGPVTPTARLLLPAGAPIDAWCDARRQGAGGSDVAAILGMDGHGGALRVWLEKTGQAPERRDARLERSARRGHALEGLVAEFFAEESGLIVLDSPGTLQHVDHPHWIANPDRLTVAPDTQARDELGVLECKTRTWRSARVENWRGDEAPDGPALQAHWYMTVTGLGFAYVAGLIDDDLTWFRLEHDDELSGLLADAVDRFWHDHVLAGLPPKPDGAEATTELLARLWDAREEATVEVDPVEVAFLTQRRSVLKERMGDLAEELGTVENRMRQLAGEAEVAMVGGREAYSWRANGQFAPARFRAGEPELAAQYSRLVPAVDVTRLEAEHPKTYRKYRARVLRVPTEG